MVSIFLNSHKFTNLHHPSNFIQPPKAYDLSQLKLGLFFKIFHILILKCIYTSSNISFYKMNSSRKGMNNPPKRV